MIIVFEGHDMTGKTNIAHELTKQDFMSKYKIFKSKAEHGRWWDPCVSSLYSWSAFLGVIELYKLDIIFDRFFPSEYAYGNAFNRNISENMIFKFDKQCADYGCVIIYCYKDEASYQEDDEKITPMDKYNDIKKYYEEFFAKTKCKVIRLNTSSENLSEQIAFLTNELKKFEVENENRNL